MGKEKPEVNVKIKLLEQKKQSLFVIIQEVYNLSLKVSDPTYRAKFLARTQSVDKIRTDFIETIDNLFIEYLNEDPDSQPSYSVHSSFDELYCFIKQTETTLKQELEDRKKNDHFNIKLPPLQLTSFDGTLSNWPVFYENFRSVIHTNPRLTNAEKVHYLIGCLSGKALNICSGITATSENYEVLWQALLDKYQDTRVQASSYLEQMLQQKPGQSVDNIIDNFCSAEAALRRLDIKDLSDFMITHIALSKLDKNTLDLFEQSHRNIDIPTFKDLKKFLSEQSKLQSLRTPSRSQPSQKQINKTTLKTKSFFAQTESQTSNNRDIHMQKYPCKVCNSNYSHPLFRCEYFLCQNPQTRNDIVMQHAFCENCLGFHNTNMCRSQNRCLTCNRKHHSLLHFDNDNNNRYQSASAPARGESAAAPSPHSPRPAVSQTPPPPAAARLPSLSHTQPRAPAASSHAAAVDDPCFGDNQQTSHDVSRANSNTDNSNFTLSVTTPARISKGTTVLLPTASVHVYNDNKQSNMRVFLDTGSMTNFVTKSCCERLNLTIAPAPSTVKGIGQIESKSLGLTQFKIYSRFDSRCCYSVTARVIDTITDFLPNAEIDTSELTHLMDIPMADDHYYAPGEIDCLIGNELFPLLLCSGKVTAPNSSVVGVQTTLGYVAMGKAPCISRSPHAINSLDQTKDSYDRTHATHARSHSSHARSHTSHARSQNSSSRINDTTQPILNSITTNARPQQSHSHKNLPLAQSSHKVSQHSRSHNAKTFFCQTESLSLEHLTHRFWEIESVPDKKHFSPDDEACEDIFQSTYSRDETGRYTVHLPFKDSPTELGNSYSIAKRRLLNLEKKLDSFNLRSDYNATIQTYVDQGYLFKIEPYTQDSPAYYMPHRAVYRPEKETSKTRVVLDAGCKTTSGKSLNDLLYVGPNLQSNIYELLINLRMFAIALTADIEKMYFQVKLSPEHQPYQRILFRFDPNAPIEVFQFNRVCFGVSSSPYLAMRVVRQLAADSRDTYPLAAYEAENHMYMDDYVCSIDGIDNAEKTYKEMVAMFESGGFNLTKWISNNNELMSRIPSSHKNPLAIKFDDDPNAETKIVGMQWQPTDDNFHFKINVDFPDKCTKRSILSVTARLFDPLGLISPVVAYMKLLVQECWKLQLDWDDEVPDCILSKWKQFHVDLSHLLNIKIPRHIGITSAHNISLIGFADASEQCYGAAIYVRIDSDENATANSVRLLTSKTKVSTPNKTLARLELCAALLLAKLLSSVRFVLSKRCIINKCYAFSDSTVTLTWIHSPAYKFQTFVANRISQINEYLPAPHWFHVRGVENPADILSRPVTPKNLVNNSLWFHGPQWLSAPITAWPVKEYKINHNNPELQETKTTSLPVHAVTPVSENTHPVHNLAERVSSWSKLLKSLVYVFRFSKLLNSHGHVTVKDLDHAECYLIRYIQNKYFSHEIHAIKNNKIFPSRAILKLNPFLDEKGLIRVGGRLTQAQLDFDQKHPILLPAKDRIISLLVDYYHISNLHASPGLLLALIRQKYWIVSARNLIRQRVHSCNLCFRLNPRNTTPLMGDLPSIRVTQVKSFVHTAVDYAGPFYITHIRHRGVKSHKAYICLFVCLTTKALHLELVSDLSTDLFLAAFKRFISRRGPVSVIYSDGGTNFIGAKRKLNEIYSHIQSTDFERYLSRHLIEYKIQFKHSPPYGPHFNGLSEANVKSVKTQLFKTIGTQILTYEEFNTILVQIEGLLNSRPICVLSSDPSDLSALTPNHFLNITPLKFLPAEYIDSTLSDNRLNRYQLLNRIVQSYWKRWSMEYLTSLQQREKWNTPSKPVTVGTIVVMKDNNSHPMCWPLAIVTEIFPGKDNIIRAVKVKTATASYIRPVTRLCPLPSQ